MYERWFYFYVVVSGAPPTVAKQYIRVRAEHIGEAMQHMKSESIYEAVEWCPERVVPVREDGTLNVAVEYTLGDDDDRSTWGKGARSQHLN